MASAKIIDYKRGVLTTTDAGVAVLDIPVPTNSILGYVARIVPKGPSNIGGIFSIEGAITNNAGVVAIIGVSVPITPQLSASIALATAVFTANSTNLRLTVTGVAAIGVLEWQYEIKTIVN